MISKELFVRLLRKTAERVSLDVHYACCGSFIAVAYDELGCGRRAHIDYALNMFNELLRTFAPTYREAYGPPETGGYVFPEDLEVSVGKIWWHSYRVCTEEGMAANNEERQMFLLFLAEFVENDISGELLDSSQLGITCAEVMNVLLSAAQRISEDNELSVCQALYITCKDRPYHVGMLTTVRELLRQFAPYGRETDFAHGELPDGLIHTQLSTGLLWWNFRARMYNLDQEATSNTDANSDNEDPCASSRFLYRVAIAQVAEERMMFLMFIAHYVETDGTTLACPEI